jgi:hypothetical protein
MKLLTLSTMLLVAVSCSKKNGTPPPPTSADGDVVGKLVVGYQGWFSAPGDGSPLNAWYHQNLEMWPDTREYTKLYTGSPFYQAGVIRPPFTGTLNNGGSAGMFSAYDQSTVNLHFSWMKQYGIDCAALQRFGSELDYPNLKAQRDSMAVKVRAAAEANGVKFYIMYDITGWTSFQTEIKSDWTNYMSALTASKAYAMQNGKPVVCVWGLGVQDRPGNVNSWKDVLSWFKAQGCYVIAGAWYNFATDVPNQPAYNTADMIMPWRVGTQSGFAGEDKQDIAYCNKLGIDYQTDIYPGYAFYNTNGASSPKNFIPRMHGNFMWSQFQAAQQAGVKSVFISMFDEMNEGTAILKCAEDTTMIPKGAYFLTLDADGTHVSSDYYLRLTNNGQQMIKGATPYLSTNPTSFQ